MYYFLFSYQKHWGEDSKNKPLWTLKYKLVQSETEVGAKGKLIKYLEIDMTGNYLDRTVGSIQLETL